jgi:adenylate kinase
MKNATRKTGKALIVTGTPGTGKTTFAKLLARDLHATYVPLTKFVSVNKLYSGWDLARKSMLVDIAKVRAKLTNLVKESPGFIIVESHIPDQIISKGLVKHVFVLRCNPRILERRLQKKRWATSKIRENVLAELLDACFTSAVHYYGSRRVVQLDTSHMSVKKSVAAAKKILGQPGKQSLKIDWIKKLNRGRQLDRYLK